ncbi:MAG: IclR family transcriptional regulator C-terminal domain-containing protein [Hyphomicrobiaceae bacterium]
MRRASSTARRAAGGRPRAASAPSTSQGAGEGQDKEFMTTLAKGFAVLSLFGRDRPSLTLSEAAAATDLSRATARRILRTLTGLGYLDQQGRQFSLAAGILRLGFSYLAAQTWIERARPLMKELSERFHESCSAAILQGTEAVYVARVPAGRIMSVAISIGTRLPAFHTAIGRIQLGYLDDAELWRRLRSLRLEPYTPSTIIDMQALFERIRADREQGFSIVDEELERGLRAIAVPVLDRAGQAIGALNLSTHTTRTTRNEMREQFLPALREVAEAISATIA